MNPHFVPATLEHAQQLAPSMRLADLEECRALGYSDGLAALEVSLRESVQAFAVFAGDTLLAVCGVVDVEGRGCVWALTAKATDRHRGAFMRASHAFVHVMQQRFPVLFQLVDARYQRALRWLERLGFTAGREVLINGFHFHLVTREA